MGNDEDAVLAAELEGAVAEPVADDEARRRLTECADAKAKAEQRQSGPVWVHAHLELKAVTDGDESQRSWRTPIAWSLAVPDTLKGLFPAVSRDGQTVVQIYELESADIIDDRVTRMAVFSAQTGKRLATFVLDSTYDREFLDGRASPEALRVRRERDGVAANRVLDANEWTHLAASRSPSGPCPGSPWTTLDEARSRREGWSWSSGRVARFDEEGMDLEYDPAADQITIRTLHEDGSLSTATVASGLVRPCGYGAAEIGGGFGSRALGLLFLHGEGYSLPCPVGGHGCALPPMVERTSALRIGPAHR